MSFALGFLAEAAAELECIVGDYEARNPGLGLRFRQEIENVVFAMAQNPFLWRERVNGYRRINLKGFPYLYCVRDH